MSDYRTGHVKRNAETQEIALRTHFEEAVYPDMTWLVATVNIGARHTSTDKVDAWADLYVPPAPVDPAQPAAEPAAPAA